MKKIIIYILGIVFVSFLIPIFFTNVKKVEVNSNIVENEENIVKQEQGNTYEYKNYNTIKLLHNSNNEIEEIKLDDYLLGVVSAEMPVDFEIEALKAQAVVARTYTIYTIIHNKGKHGEADICDSSSCCQAWITKENRMSRWEENKRESNWNKITEAVNTTARKNNYISRRTDKCFFSF